MLTPEQAGQKLQELAPSDELLQFARALVEAGAFFHADVRDPAGAFLYFLEKPWKWADDFAAWDANGRPMDHSEPGWSLFVEAVEQ